jgi:acyl dehydratase
VKLYLDALTPGTVFEAGPVGVSEAEILAFARAYDPQYFHTDPEAAKAHPVFAGHCASGWHTAALTMRMTVEAFGSRLPWGVIGGQGDLQWPKPVRPGDTLSLRSEVVEVTPSRSRPDRGVVLFRNTTLNQHGEPVQVFTVKVLVPVRPASEADPTRN